MDYIHEKFVTAKGNLRELLRETRAISHKSFEQISEGEDSSHYKDIEASLEVIIISGLVNIIYC